MAVSAGALVSAMVTRALASPRSPIVVLDHPNDRSLHAVPTPRTGGIGLAAGVSAGVAVLLSFNGAPPQDVIWTLVAALAVAIVSFCDDLWTLPPLVRFILQLAAASALVFGGGVVLSRVSAPIAGELGLRVAGAPLTVLLVVWIANLFNFMDGLDGLAGGMAVSGFGFLAVVAMAADETWVGGVSATIAASAAGFCLFNLPPARIFLGDVGSVPLGFIAGAMAVRMDQTRTADLWIPLLMFSPFVVDATVVVVRRLSRGEKVWEPHRTHWYQRITLAGWSRRRTLIFEYALMLAAGVSALVYASAGDFARAGVLAAWTLVYVWFDRTVSAVERQARAEAQISGSRTAAARQT